MLPRLRVVDLSHPFSIHTPGWAGYPPVKHYYIQRLSSNEIVAQYVEPPLHVSAHLDGHLIGVFPRKFIGGEASISRVVAFLPD